MLFHDFDPRAVVEFVPMRTDNPPSLETTSGIGVELVSGLCKFICWLQASSKIL